MTLDDARSRKEVLETTIRTMIREFEAMTGLVVEHVDLTRESVVGRYHGQLLDVRVDVDL